MGGLVKELQLVAPVEEFLLTWCSSSEPEETNALDILTWIAAFDDSPWRMLGDGMTHHFSNGTKSMVDAIAADTGAEIRLNSPVARVEQTNAGVVVTIRSGESFTAAASVVAIPFNVWNDVEFDTAIRSQAGSYLETSPGTYGEGMDRGRKRSRRRVVGMGKWRGSELVLPVLADSGC